MADIEKCKKCGLPLKPEIGREAWCSCEIGVDVDENGEPLAECREHGFYREDNFGCPGCEAIEDEIDRAIERDHNGGKLI